MHFFFNFKTNFLLFFCFVSGYSPPSCGICDTKSALSFSKRKYGISLCEACRKFLSNCQSTTRKSILECEQKNGQCEILPIEKSQHIKNVRKSTKMRCHACWLKKCIKTIQVPSDVRLRLSATLPVNMRDKEINSIILVSPFSIKKEITAVQTPSTTTTTITTSVTSATTENNSTNIFSTQTGGRLLSWPQDCIEMDFKTSKILSLTNPLAENNSTFGSSPLIKPNITEKPVFMVNSLIDEKPDDSHKMKTRKKEREAIPMIVAPTPIVTTTTEPPKRQRIDLKGPRVKHVCRSASIVLGQPIATFSNESSALLESMDTPPRPDSPNIDIVDLPQTNCTDCTLNPSDLGLSPPATPIEVQEDCEEAIVPEIIKEVIKEKPITRKLTRPALISQNIASMSHKNLNSFSKIIKPNVPVAPPMISLDFWENYDPAEVSRTGFGLIISESIPLRALCFLCGSFGLDSLIYCICCCEPYHQYCVEDEYNLRQPALDETNVSFLDNTIIGNGSLNRLNWLCPRCTVCYTCNMSSGSKLKCQKCQKNYHSTCLGTSKRLLGADRPLICANCLKCKSCGTANVTKFIGNLPMCTSCFKLRQKGNFCPLCQKCYEDNDFDLKMMECGGCERWVHAKCEGLSDEDYNMLSVLPESIEFFCKKCSKNNPSSNAWREAVLAELKTGLLSVVKILSKSRQACALLKLSPRKKANICVCQPVLSNRILQFNKNTQQFNESDDDDGDDDMIEVPNLPISINQQQQQQQPSNNKCYCGLGQKTIVQQHQQQQANIQSLLDVKTKIISNDYYTVYGFNYDMQLVINGVSCDDLMIVYKEILSEQFPWFQNETKACTDALEEDMYDSTGFEQTTTNIEIDQEVPMIDIPDDTEDYFYEPYQLQDNRICMFCKG